MFSLLCSQAKNKATENDFYNKLHKKYQDFFENHVNQIEYYKNIGKGVINPKDFHFQLIADTTSMQRIEIEDIENQEILIPLFWKPDYLIFYMIVVGSTENWYEVRANDEMTIWVNKSEFDFYTWEIFFLNETIGITANIAYREKNIHSKSIELTDKRYYMLIVEKVEDEWLYVREETEDNSVIDRYWIRWKDKNNKLLVAPIMLM